MRSVLKLKFLMPTLDEEENEVTKAARQKDDAKPKTKNKKIPADDSLSRLLKKKSKEKSDDNAISKKRK